MPARRWRTSLDLPARRAVPDQHRRPAAHRDRHPAPGRSPALAAVRATRPVRAIVSCRIHAPRENYHRAAREAAGAADQGLRRHRRRVQRPSVGVGAGADPSRCARDPVRFPGSTCANSSSDWSPRRGAGATTQGRADRRPRRGARQRDAAPVRPRVPAELPGRVRSPRRRARHPADGRPGDAQPIAMTLYQPLEVAGHAAASLLRRGEPLTLSGSLPMLESTWPCACSTSTRTASSPLRPLVRMHDFGRQIAGAGRSTSRPTRLRPVFEDAFGAILRGEVENDDFNLIPSSPRASRRGDRRPARLREVPAPDRVCASVAVVHRGHAGGVSGDRARARRVLFKARFDPGRATGTDRALRRQGAAIEAAPRGASRTCPRIACCASTWR